MDVKVGCCGFPVRKDKYYQNFNLVEIQKTFYQPPQPATVERWRKEAPSGFEFTLKAWQLITHPSSSPTYRKIIQQIPEDLKQLYGFFKPTREVFSAWEKTREIALNLRARIVVFQCPASFKPDKVNKRNLMEFFRKIKEKDFTFVFVWEPRGKWQKEEIKSICKALDLIHCVDPFKNKPALTGEINYFRLHGKGGYRYRYTDDDLSYLKKLCADAPVTYVMFNNVYMFQDALRFKNLLQNSFS